MKEIRVGISVEKWYDEDSWSEEKLEGGFLNEESINNRCRAGGIDSSI